MFRAICNREFRELFERCTPPQGWPQKLAIANSGGPDSTCLLFLLRRFLQESEGIAFPKSLVSLTVDHCLQEASSAMADHCSRTSTSLGIEHVTAAIPWSHPPFPHKPSRSFEKIARTARYHLLFNAMSEVGSTAIAFGHHADDQIETALLRSAKGSTEFGAAGMRPCRRWGMGFGNGEGSLGWAGIEGMRRWIVRPLLTVPKSRILATCEENGLEYVMDPTNFQPEITVRNTIRHILSRNPEYDDNPGPLKEAELATNAISPGECSTNGNSVTSNALQLPARFSLDISLGRAHLHTVVKTLSERRQQVDDVATQNIGECRRVSPPSTVLLVPYLLRPTADAVIQRAMILRIMRYVSFYPWGSLQAEAHRRTESLNQIIGKVLCSAPETFPKPFVAGGGVLWTPVFLMENGQFKISKSEDKHIGSTSCSSLPAAWIASRQPPFAKSLSDTRTSTRKDALHLNITHLIGEKVDGVNPQEEQELLWDCRFLLRINGRRLKTTVDRARSITGSEDGELLLEPETRWYLPRIVWRWTGGSIVLARMMWSRSSRTTKKPLVHIFDQDDFVSIQDARVLDTL
ncbi:hypothetical protein NEOLEDRAFT_1155713 [Neolentinus lepideus HHB14362 ss-1]|uniref:tRNA(Ile)-lysidine synthetase n=1 Tax=Neolentinus lepideus HHB14362 ss-1 TaxID=1314782 RepID=A0A165TG56_9AGAM|nr:hypothetical protein NEOLEDRAFT_1155713 [Neolentinus lepideus HHB14362 ss-1]